MKKLINIITIAAIIIVVLSIRASAQSRVVKDAQGNYLVKAWADSAKDTGHTITDRDGLKHPVLVSARGKLFYWRTSKKGNIYKCYLKTE